MQAREDQTVWLAELMIKSPLPKVVLGKAFKAGTNITTGSPAILLQNILQSWGYMVTSYDPHVDTETFIEFDKPCIFLIGTNHPEFIDFHYPKGSIVLDPWGYIPDREGVAVLRIGRKS